MFIDIGPATLVLKGEKGGKSFLFDRSAVESHLKSTLAEVAECLPVLKQKAYRIRQTAYLPRVARAMVDAVQQIDATSLTPMAAVAGAVADGLKEYLKGKGPEFISVNNGGDVAVYNGRQKPVTIGIGDVERNVVTPYVLSVEGLTDFGVATSGFGGRSFTLGLADIVSVIALSAPLADAAATYICNNTNVEDASIVRQKGAEIDPSTDIPEEMVTVKIGELSSRQVRKALDRGRGIAKRLKDEGRISEAVILFRGEMATTIGRDNHIRLEVKSGNQKGSDGRGGHLL